MSKQRKIYNEDIIDLNLHTAGPAVSPNFRVRQSKTKDVSPREIYKADDVFRGVPTPDLSKMTERPTVRVRDIEIGKPNQVLCSGTAFQTELGKFNRRGIGGLIRFVAVCGYGNWAIYYGFAELSEEHIRDYGHKVFGDEAIHTLVNCPEAITMYRN